MNIILSAMALVIAAPVAAQTTPPADPHAEHGQHHQQKPSGAPAEHKMDCTCCKGGSEAERKACCEKHAKEHAAEHGHQHAH